MILRNARCNGEIRVCVMFVARILICILCVCLCVCVCVCVREREREKTDRQTSNVIRCHVTELLLYNRVVFLFVS